MSSTSIFITRQIPQAGLDLLQGEIASQIWPHAEPPSYEELSENVRGRGGLLCLLTDQIDAALMERAGSQLKVISQMAVAVDNIDLKAATARGIPIGHTPGVLTDSTADFAWTLLLAAARRVVEADRYVRAGKWKTWSPTVLLGADIYAATLGIVGLGRIGAAVARRAAGFDMRILYSNGGGRRPELEDSLGIIHADFEALLRESDFVSIHTPYNDATHHLFGAAEFELMKSSAILINTARGGVVDQNALYTALRDGEIAHAALDVTEPEPLPLDSPLLLLENLIIVPHIASGSEETRARMAVMAAENLLAGLRGERLPYCANPEIYG